MDLTGGQSPSKARHVSDVYVHASCVSIYGSNDEPIPEQDRGVHAYTLNRVLLEYKRSSVFKNTLPAVLDLFALASISLNIWPDAFN